MQYFNEILQKAQNNMQTAQQQNKQHSFLTNTYFEMCRVAFICLVVGICQRNKAMILTSLGVIVIPPLVIFTLAYFLILKT